MASVASVLARVTTFRRLFFADQRRPGQTLALLAFFLVPLTIGVWLRFWVPNFLAADISFETVILLGLLIGPGWAMLGGAVFRFQPSCITSIWRCPSTCSSASSPA